MDAVVAVTHPLDPLSLDEIASAVAILKDTQTLAATFRFPITRLEEPTKADLAAHRPAAGWRASPSSWQSISAMARSSRAS